MASLYFAAAGLLAAWLLRDVDRQAAMALVAASSALVGFAIAKVM